MGGPSMDMNLMLDNSAQTSDNKKNSVNSIGYQDENSDKDSYTDVFPGNGLNLRELFHLSARIPVTMVMVAGTFESGKTTLVVMMYHLFREGLNAKLRFRGSKTMLGYWKRSEKLMQYSANEEPQMDRTSLGFSDNFLHLSLVDSKGKEKDVVFIDLPGEAFGEGGDIKELGELFPDIVNMIVVIDMKKIRDKSKRRGENLNTKAMLSNLIKCHILSKATSLQIVCTKMDSVKETENLDKCKSYVEKIFDEIKKEYGGMVGSLRMHFISALEIDKKEECRYLEDILENFVLTRPTSAEETIGINLDNLPREIDKFGLRE